MEGLNQAYIYTYEYYIQSKNEVYYALLTAYRTWKHWLSLSVAPFRWAIGILYLLSRHTYCYVCMYVWMHIYECLCSGAGQHEESLLYDEQHSSKLRVLLGHTSVAECQNLAVSVLLVSVFPWLSRQVLTTESKISSAIGSVPTQRRYVHNMFCTYMYVYIRNIFNFFKL